MVTRANKKVEGHGRPSRRCVVGVALRGGSVNHCFRGKDDGPRRPGLYQGARAPGMPTHRAVLRGPGSAMPARTLPGRRRGARLSSYTHPRLMRRFGSSDREHGPRPRSTPSTGALQRLPLNRASRTRASPGVWCPFPATAMCDEPEAILRVAIAAREKLDTHLRRQLQPQRWTGRCGAATEEIIQELEAHFRGTPDGTSSRSSGDGNGTSCWPRDTVDGVLVNR